MSRSCTYLVFVFCLLVFFTPFISHASAISQVSLPTIDSTSSLTPVFLAGGEVHPGSPDGIGSSAYLDQPRSLTGCRGKVFFVDLRGLRGFDLPTLQLPFAGVVHISSNAVISLSGIRGHYNTRHEFIIAAVTPLRKDPGAPASSIYFPHLIKDINQMMDFLLGFSFQPKEG